MLRQNKTINTLHISLKQNYAEPETTGLFGALMDFFKENETIIEL
jgi:hypothetical protein